MTATANNGITIRNCILDKYTRGMLAQDGLSNSIIELNQITDSTAGISIETDTMIPTISTKTIIQDNTFSLDNDGVGKAIHMFSGNDNNITRNTISNTAAGILIDFTSATTLEENTISSTLTGVEILGGSSNILFNNNIHNNGVGIRLDGSSGNNKLEGNSVEINSIGLHVKTSSNNEILGNTFSENSDKGIIIGFGTGDSTSNNNRVHENNFIANAKAALDDGTNMWNSTKIGNYWDKYATLAQGCEDKDIDNICDMPLGINEEKVLMQVHKDQQQP
jgi:parallel beta-helix repeat protein